MIINCTPHLVTVARRTIEPSGTVPRVSVRQVEDGDIDGIPVVRTVYGAVEGLPSPVEGTTYIVSALVLSALAGSRQDVCAPDTSPASALRNEAGQIIGVRRLTR